MNKNDWLGLIAIAIMLIGAGMIIYYYTTESINKCTRDPLRFTADKLAGEKNYSYAIINVYTFKGDKVPIVRGELDLSNYTMPRLIP